jgi:Mrp family chromosome partitioning ATPase
VETVAFYSYKGGVGRSLLLAYAARYLAAILGKRVVALDFDFEAPGLHYKLKFDITSDPHLLAGGGGSVPYLLATTQGFAFPPPLKNTWSTLGMRTKGAGSA